MDSDSTFTLHTGREMPMIGLGTWQLTDDTPSAVAHALDIGYRMIDTSGDYGTQPGIAQGIQDGGFERDDFYMVTKVEETDDAYEATQRDLQELQLDYADLMLIHRPPATGSGEDLWRGLIRAREDGLTADIGVSNYSISQIEDLIDATGEKPVVNQVEWSPFGYSEDMLEYCRDNGIIIQAYSPLTRARRLDEPVLSEIAAGYDKTPAQLLIRWNLQHGVAPLPKANHEEHQEENLDVFDFEISDDDMKRLDGLNEGYSALS